MAESAEPTDNPLQETQEHGDDSKDSDNLKVFPEVDNVTEENLQLPYEKKLELFTKDAETLYEFAVAKGLSSKQMKTCLSPFLEHRSFGRRVASDTSRWFLTLSCIIGLCAIAWQSPAIKNFIIIHARLLSVKTIPYYDWTSLYNEDCIFYNPYLPPEKNLTRDDCIPCMELNGGEVDRLEDVDLKMITDEYMYADFPFVVLDGARNWPKDVNGDLAFSMDRVNELFQDHTVLTTAATDCEFFSTMDDTHNISLFVEMMSKQELPEKFHVAWENCDASAAKVFRLLAPRPYFIPAFAEASRSNQIVIAKGKFDDHEFEIPQQVDQATWLTVVQGELKIFLKPHSQCSKFRCKETVFIVGDGESVVVPSRIWNMTYAPTQDLYTMAFASSLLWDDVM